MQRNDSRIPLSEKPLPTTKYAPFDPHDISWWEKKEMGSDDDPYNQIPKVDPSSPEYEEYVKLAEHGFDTILQEFESEEGWVLAKEDKGVTIHCKDIPDDPVRCFRGVGIIHASAEVLRLHLVQIDLRHHWDPMFLGGRYHVEVTDNVRVVYYSFKAPWPVTNRDFVAVAGEKITEDGIVISAVNSIERADCPEVEGFVRGILKTSGFVIKPIDNDEDGRPRCMVTYLVQLNPMGWIPTMVVNLVNVDQPLCIDNIRTAIALTEIMVEQAITKLFEMPEEEWKADNIRRLLAKVIDSNNGKREMLFDPIQYVITGSRKTERAVEEVMEEMGKRESMRRAWIGAEAYCKSIRKRQLYDAAANFFGEQEEQQ